MDFISDELFDGRRVLLSTIVDHFTGESLTIEVGPSINGQRVVEGLARLVMERRLTETIRVNNGPEFTSKRLDQCAYLSNVGYDFSRPEKLLEIPFLEAFNGRLRQECLNESWFLSLEDAIENVEAWRERGDGERPHGALRNPVLEKFAMPLEEAGSLARSAARVVQKTR